MQSSKKVKDMKMDKIKNVFLKHQIQRFELKLLNSVEPIGEALAPLITKSLNKVNETKMGKNQDCIFQQYKYKVLS